jgi:hypothetical protein
LVNIVNINPIVNKLNENIIPCTVDFFDYPSTKILIIDPRINPNKFPPANNNPTAVPSPTGNTN